MSVFHNGYLLDRKYRTLSMCTHVLRPDFGLDIIHPLSWFTLIGSKREKGQRIPWSKACIIYILTITLKHEIIFRGTQSLPIWPRRSVQIILKRKKILFSAVRAFYINIFIRLILTLCLLQRKERIRPCPSR